MESSLIVSSVITDTLDGTIASKLLKIFSYTMILSSITFEFEDGNKDKQNNGGKVCRHLTILI